MENQDKTVDPTDKDLRTLIEWMLESITVRDLLKRLIDSRELQEQIWLQKSLNEIKGR